MNQTRDLERALASLPPDELDRIEQILREGDTSSFLWAPNPGPQRAAYESEADLLLYGGAAGGGKSDLALGLALTKHHRSIILRVENTNNRGLIDRLTAILGTQDGWSGQTNRWKIPEKLAPALVPPFSLDPTLRQSQLVEFGSTPNPGDEQKHQGIPHDLLVFDEAAQFPEHVVRYLMTWNRSAYPGTRCRTLLTSNPPTPDNTAKSRSTGLWLINMFAPWLDPTYRDPFGRPKPEPGELRWYVTLDGRDEPVSSSEPFISKTTVFDPVSGEEIEKLDLLVPKSRTFIPAKVQDNPHLMRDSHYLATLQALPEELRQAMLEGDFGVSLSDRPMQLFPTQWVRDAVARHKRHQDASDRSQAPLPDTLPMTAIAADVSRGGQDDTIIGARHNGWVPKLIVYPGSRVPDGPTAAGYIVAARRNDAEIIIDANGVGASCYDHLSSQRISARAYVGSNGTERRDRSGKFGFPNVRSAAYWNLREILDPSNPLSKEVALPDDDRLVQELLEHTWEERGGKIHIITKDKVKEQLRRSPDRADTVVMLFYLGEPLQPGVLPNVSWSPLNTGYRRGKDGETFGYARTDWSRPLTRQRG